MPSIPRFQRRAAPLLVVIGAAAFGVGAIGVASLDTDLAAAARPVHAEPGFSLHPDCPRDRDQRAPVAPKGL
jgi:hypothetical protein